MVHGELYISELHKDGLYFRGGSRLSLQPTGFEKGAKISSREKSSGTQGIVSTDRSIRPPPILQ